MGSFSKGIFSKLLRHRLVVVLMCFILVFTLLDVVLLALHGAKAAGGSTLLPVVRCHGDKPCLFLASTDFSATQGQDQWDSLFSLDQEKTFAPMTYDSATTSWQGTEGGCLTGANWQHPGPSLCDSVRTWVAPGPGSVTLTANGAISVATNCPGSTNTNGVQIRVLLNGVQLWPATGWQGIANGATFSSFPAVTTSVQAADQIHFVVAHAGSNNECDTTTWDQLVTFMPL